jgi:mannosyltransferase
MNRKYRYEVYGPLSVIILIAAALRLYALGRVSFWFDEAITLWWTENIGTLFMPAECAPPLYPILVLAWKSFCGNEFFLRLLSAIFGTATVIMVYFTGKRFFDKRAALTASFLLAISPFHIFYSRELTPYALLAFLVLMSVYFFKKALERPEWRLWTGFAFFGGLSVLTHYAAGFIFLAEMIFFLISWKKYGRLVFKWLAAHALMAVFLFPYGRLIVAQIFFGVKVNLGWWIPSLPPEALIVTFKNFSAGYNAVYWNFIITSAVWFFLFFAGVFSLKKKKDHMLPVLLTVVPILSAYIALKFNVKAYVDRYFLPSAVFYCLIAARGVCLFGNKYVITGFLLIITVLNGFSLKNYYSNYLPNSYEHHIGVQRKPDFREAYSYLAANFQQGDAVIHTNENSILPLNYYLSSFSLGPQPWLWVKFADTPGGDMEILEYKMRDQIPDNERRGADKNVVLDNSRRIWLAVMTFEGSAEQQRAVLKQMERVYKRIDSKGFYGVELFLYENSSFVIPAEAGI